MLRIRISAEDRDPAPSLVLLIVEKTAQRDRVPVDLRVLRARSDNAQVSVRRARFDLEVGAHLGCDSYHRRRTREDGFGVLGRQFRRGPRSHSVKPELARPHREDVGSQVGDLLLHGPLGSLTESDHGDHGRNADHDAPRMVSRMSIEEASYRAGYRSLRWTPGTPDRERIRWSNSCC